MPLSKDMHMQLVYTLSSIDAIVDNNSITCIRSSFILVYERTEQLTHVGITMEREQYGQVINVINTHTNELVSHVFAS